MEEFLDKATETIPTFAGLKCSTSVLLDFSIGLKYERKNLAMFYGGDEVMCLFKLNIATESRKRDGSTAVSRRKVLLLNVIFEDLRKV